MTSSGPPSVVSAIDRGADPSGRKDSTDAIQAALDEFQGGTSTGVVSLPTGDYRITRTLVYRGNYSHGIRIVGEHATIGLAGTRLLWDGPPGAIVLSLLGASSTYLERLSIDGGGKAAVALNVAYDEARKVGTTNIAVLDCSLGGCVGDRSAAARLGYLPGSDRPDNRQVDRVLFERCSFVGQGVPGTTHYGLLTAADNCKNFSIRDCGFSFFRVGLRYGGAGIMIVDGFTGGANTEADIQAGPGILELRGGQSEDSARLLIGTASVSPGTVILSGWNWVGYAPPDDMVVSYGGFLKMEGNQVLNMRTPTSQAKICLGVGPGICASLDSRGNFLRNASGVLPVFDGSGNALTPTMPEFYKRFNWPPLIHSSGDYGGEAGKQAFLDPLGRGPSSPPPRGPRGIASIPKGRTWVLVEHGLPVAPDLPDVTLTPIDLGKATQHRLIGTNATQLQVGIDRDPGPAGARVAWRVDPPSP